MLWISCLLISSVTCLPAPKGNVGCPKNAQFCHLLMSANFTFKTKLMECYAPTGVAVKQAPAGSDAAGVGSWYDNSGFANPAVGSVDAGFYYANSGSTGGDGAYAEFPSDGGEEERSKPVFSDVSHLEPVYSFRSRSRYNNGRRQYFRTSYIPGHIRFPPMPVAENRPQRLVKA